MARGLPTGGSVWFLPRRPGTAADVWGPSRSNPVGWLGSRLPSRLAGLVTSSCGATWVLRRQTRLSQATAERTSEALRA